MFKKCYVLQKLLRIPFITLNTELYKTFTEQKVLFQFYQTFNQVITVSIFMVFESCSSNQTGV